jgi:hypothetical protein
MAIKQIKQRFQVSSDDDVATQVTVTASGNVVFSGSLEQTTTAIIPEDVRNNTTPYAEIIFDLDVPVYAAGQTDSVTVPMMFTCSGGNIALQGTWANYSLTFAQDPNDLNHWMPVPGTAVDFVMCDISTQPLVNGEIMPGRYDLNSNFHVTGPGAMIMLAGETVTLGSYVPRFASPPAP